MLGHDLIVNTVLFAEHHCLLLGIQIPIKSLFLMAFYHLAQGCIPIQKLLCATG